MEQGSKNPIEDQICLQELRKINADHEILLQKFGIGLNELPSDVKKILNEIVDFQNATKLTDLDKSYLDEWSMNRRKVNFDNEIELLKINQDIKNMETENNQIDQKNNELKKILKSETTNNESEDNMKTEIANLKQQIDLMEQQGKQFVTIQDVNFDEILRKAELLNKSNK